MCHNTYLGLRAKGTIMTIYKLKKVPLYTKLSSSLSIDSTGHRQRLHSLATAIEKILGDESRQQEIRENGRKRALQFSMKSLAKRYLDSYQELLKAL